jgi:hypothetical protein
LYESVKIRKGEVPNLNTQDEITTDYGKLLTNYTLLINAFGKKVEYINKKFSISDVEKIILPRFKANPKEGDALNENDIYVNEYLTLADATGYVAGMALICVPTSSPKSIVRPDWVIPLRDKLVKQYAGHLDDPTVVAKIEAELVAKYNEWIKGDDSLNFLLNNKKDIGINKKKLFLSIGAEVGLDSNSTKVHYIQKSLSEGWDLKEFKHLNDSLRLGSYSRGQETELGGVSFKYLIRSSQNLNVTIDDCGSTDGRELYVNDITKNRLVGFKMLLNSKWYKVNTLDEAGTYLGKTVKVRSPMYCKAEQTDYCKACLGETLSLNPKGLSIAVAGYGSTLLLIKMKAAHGKALILERMDLEVSLN